MNPRWADVEGALDTILSLPEFEWPAACQRLAAGDATLQRELESLVAHAGGFDSVLDQGLRWTTTMAGVGDSGSLAGGTRLGAFRIVRLIGRGGMGEVYLAERADGQFQQHVALKLLMRDAIRHMDRFQVERQVLARMEHPGIAHLIDAGLTEDARPYMVVELVSGQPIVEWCNARHSDLAERLRLFEAICDSVAYAHRNLIVHRDLKPANVLVTDDGVVKLLDFGVAKLLERGDDEQTHDAPMTPAYAAPEQLSRGTVTTATDIFALGVLLFELLAGERPWPIHGLPLALGLEKVVREPAPRMSARAAARSNAPVAPSLLRGDLDAIVAKCLRKEPEQRYATVAALQLDVARTQRHEPVEARAGARLYVVRRFFRRHRAGAATGLFVAALIASAGVAVISQAHRARQEAERATATRNFLVSVFAASDPRKMSAKPLGGITARELLDASAGRIEREFNSDPATEIELLGTVSAIYRELGEFDRYAAMHRTLLDVATKHFGPLHPVVLKAELDEADLDNSREEFGRAARVLARIDPLIGRADTDRGLLRARWLLEHAMSLAADPTAQPRRLEELKQSAALFEAAAADDPGHVTALSELGTYFVGTADLATAADYYRRAIDTAQHLNDRNDAELLTIYGNLAMVQQQAGHYAEADAAYTMSEQIAARTYGLDTRNDWVPRAQHARTLHLFGERDRAWAILDPLIARLPPTAAVDHDAALVREIYGECLAAEGRPMPAIPLLEAAVAAYAVRPEFVFESVRARLYLGDAYDLAGDETRARKTLRAVLDERLATGSQDAQALLAARERWGRFLIEHGDVAAARAQFLAVVKQDHGRNLSHVALAYGGLARVALKSGDIASARDFAHRAVERFNKVQGFRDVRMGPYLWQIDAEVLRRAGEMAAAQRLARRALDADRRYDAPSAAAIAAAQTTLREITAAAPSDRAERSQAAAAERKVTARHAGP